jgi:hypothetical protein
MTFTPTNRTAALAGAWCAIGLIPFDAWEEHNKLATVTSHNIAFAAFAVVFLVVPAYFLVFGHGHRHPLHSPRTAGYADWRNP